MLRLPLLILFTYIVCSADAKDAIRVTTEDLTRNSFLSPPVIDIQSLLPHSSVVEDISQRKLTTHKIGEAVTKWGFFYVTNHSISSELLSDLINVTEMFFLQSTPDQLDAIRRTSTNSRGYTDSEFTKQKIDLKRVFDVSHKIYPDLNDDHPDNAGFEGHNQWPRGAEFHPRFRAIVEKYYSECEKVSKILMEAILSHLIDINTNDDEMIDINTNDENIVSNSSNNLNVSFSNEESNYVVSSVSHAMTNFINHTSFLRLNYYPPTVIESINKNSSSNNNKSDIRSDLGVSRHTDAGLLTILLQGNVPGLEVYTGSKQEFNDGEWVAVDPVAGALTINVGDMIQVLSNGRFKAAEHRVRATPAGTPARYSAPFFFNPDYKAVIAPILNSKIVNTTTACEVASDVIANGVCTNINNSDSTAGATNTPKYRGINWGQFRMARFSGDYSDVGREIQIEDFLIL